VIEAPRSKDARSGFAAHFQVCPESAQGGKGIEAPVAQWIEQLPSKQWAGRSSRPRRARKGCGMGNARCGWFRAGPAGTNSEIYDPKSAMEWAVSSARQSS
jgi:hypothetical protein